MAGDKHASGPSGPSGRRRAAEWLILSPVLNTDSLGVVRLEAIETSRGERHAVKSWRGCVETLATLGATGRLASFDGPALTLGLQSIMPQSLRTQTALSDRVYAGAVRWESMRSYRTTVRIGQTAATIWDLSGWDWGGLEETARAWSVCRLGDELRAETWSVVWDQIRAEAKAFDYGPATLSGPAAISGEMLREAGMPEWTPEPMDETLALHGYYGGRIQALQIGRFPGASHYDLASAYGRALGCLPQPGGRLERMGNPTPTEGESPWWLADVEWESPDDSQWGPFPVRTDDEQIIYPLRGRGIYWGPEVIEAAAAGSQVTIRKRWKYTAPGGTDDPEPWHSLASIVDVANHWRHSRAEEGRTGAAQMVKRSINAIYGKLAQGASYDRGKRPRFQNFILAGMVTSLVRAELLRVLAAMGGRVIAMQTDGIWITGEERLGEFADSSAPLIRSHWRAESLDVFELRLYHPVIYDWRQRAEDRPELTASGMPNGYDTDAWAAEWTRRGPFGRGSYDVSELTTPRQSGGDLPRRTRRTVQYGFTPAGSFPDMDGIGARMPESIRLISQSLEEGATSRPYRPKRAKLEAGAVGDAVEAGMLEGWANACE